MNISRLGAAFRLAALFAPAIACAAPATTWRVTPLSDPSWFGGSCSAIDAKGRVAGTANVGGDQFGLAAFFYDGRSARTWGSASVEKDGATANALSDKGLVVGTRITDRTFGFHVAVVFRGDGPHALPPLGGGGQGSQALGVNRVGDIVGGAETDSGQYHAVRWHDGQVADLAPASSSSEAVAINASGMVVGNADGALASFAPSGPVPLAGLEQSTGRVSALNDAGVVAGYVNGANGLRQAFTWHDGVVTTLATPADHESVPSGMNDTGAVVGYVHRSATFSGVVWQDGSLVVLDDALAPGTPAGWHIEQANAINDAGQICAEATKLHKQRQLVLLTPVR